MLLVLCLIVEERERCRCLGVSLLCNLDGAQEYCTVYAPFSVAFREIVHTNSVITHSCS